MLKASSLSTQKMANDITLAKRTRTVVSRWPSEYFTEMWRAIEAPTMEKAMPAAAMTQKGTTSFMKCDRPCLPQAHFRFSQ